MFILYPLALVIAGFLIALSVGSREFHTMLWFVSITLGFLSLCLIIALWQLQSYKNPVLQLTQTGLLFYGTLIPWDGIRSTYVGTSNFYVTSAGGQGAMLPHDRLWIEIENRDQLRLTAPSKRFMYHLARVLLRRSGGKLLVPIVKEWTVEQLASDIEERISL